MFQADHIREGCGDGNPIDSVMSVESTVFGLNDRGLKGGRDITQKNPFEPPSTVANPQFMYDLTIPIEQLAFGSLKG
jgi:hypothetical protein